jgi:multiple sugar transport system permease protein
MSNSYSLSQGSPASKSWRTPFGLSRNTRIALAFLLPSIILLALIILFPIIYSLNLTFHSYSLVIPGKTGQWAGLANYVAFLKDKNFWAALGRVGLFSVLAVSFEVVIGIAFAWLLNAIHRGRRLLTSLLLIPTILTPVVIGLMFNLIFNAQFGLFNYLLQLAGIQIQDGILNNPTTAFAALVSIDVWEWMPFIALIMLAGMQAIPEQPLEAAQIDGANGWQIFWQIMLPMLRPVLVVAVLFRAAEAIREFDKVYILTGGGPGTATEVADLYLYRVSFSNWDLSYGATLGMVMFALAMVVAVLYFYITVKRGENQ